VGDHPLRRQLEIARLLVQVAREQREQARLAAAVGAGDADLPAGMQAEADVFDQRPPGDNLLHRQRDRRGKKALLYAP